MISKAFVNYVTKYLVRYRQKKYIILYKLDNFPNPEEIISHAKAVFYNDDMQNNFYYNDKDVSHTNYQKLRNFLAIDDNTKSYKTNSKYKSSGIFSN